MDQKNGSFIAYVYAKEKNKAQFHPPKNIPGKLLRL